MTAADVKVSDVHRLVMTRDYHRALPDSVRVRLHSSVVEELEPLVQQHDIEGLLMGG